jgi:hypothetical protein
MQVAHLHKIDIEGPCKGGAGTVEERRTENWVEETFGDGPQCFYCMVKIPSKYQHLLGEASSAEVNGLSNTWEDEYSSTTSRLACLIKLERKHDGMVVFVPDAPPTDIP